MVPEGRKGCLGLEGNSFLARDFRMKIERNGKLPENQWPNCAFHHKSNFSPLFCYWSLSFTSVVDAHSHTQSSPLNESVSIECVVTTLSSGQSAVVLPFSSFSARGLFIVLRALIIHSIYSSVLYSTLNQSLINCCWVNIFVNFGMNGNEVLTLWMIIFQSQCNIPCEINFCLGSLCKKSFEGRKNFTSLDSRDGKLLRPWIPGMENFSVPQMIFYICHLGKGWFYKECYIEIEKLL